MTRADIIRMAREAGFGPAVEWPECYPPFERFAVIVAAAKQLEIEGLRIRLLAAERGEQEAARAEDLHRQAEALLTGDERQAVAKAVAAEREACAKFCESNQVARSPRGGRSFTPFDGSDAGTHEGMDYAAAIRARSQQPEKHTPCAGKPTNNPPSPGAWEFYQPCHHCLRRLAQGSEPRPAPPEFVDGECPSRIGAAP